MIQHQIADNLIEHVARGSGCCSNLNSPPTRLAARDRHRSDGTTGRVSRSGSGILPCSYRLRLTCPTTTGKTEWEIDTWSYRRGVQDGYIPSDVSNASTLAFPILGNGCVDSSFNYTAPSRAGAAAGGRATMLGSARQVVVIGMTFIILGFVSL